MPENSEWEKKMSLLYQLKMSQNRFYSDSCLHTSNPSVYIYYVQPEFSKKLIILQDGIWHFIS